MSTKDALDASEVKGEILFSGDKVYKKVYNVDTISQEYGFPVCYSTANGSGEEVDQPATATLASFAGIVNNPFDPTDTSYTIPTVSYGWICIRGQVKAMCEGTADIGINASLKAVNTKSYLVVDQAAGTEAALLYHAVALEAHTPATEVLIDVYVKAFL